VHIHPGDSISLAVGNEIQTIQGEWWVPQFF
jgi:hypothetical protein